MNAKELIKEFEKIIKGCDRWKDCGIKEVLCIYCEKDKDVCLATAKGYAEGLRKWRDWEIRESFIRGIDSELKLLKESGLIA